MTKTELAYSIGEYISMEIDDAAIVGYEPETEQAIKIIVQMENGKKLAVCVTEVN